MIYDLMIASRSEANLNHQSSIINAMRCLIVGCGYVGLPLGAELVRQGHEVFGLRRSAAAAKN